MFIGYQGELAAFVTNTREELINSPFIEISGIKEVGFAEMFSGVVYTSKEDLFQVKTKAVEETRAGLYTTQVDPITAQINRLRDEEQTPETVARIEELKLKRSAKVEEIKTNNPYPSAEENTEPTPSTSVVEESETVVTSDEEPSVELAEGSDNEVVELYSMEI